MKILSKSIDGKMLFSKLSFDIQKNQKIAFLSRDPLALTTFFEVINGRSRKQMAESMNGEQRLPQPICRMTMLNILKVVSST
ncbi:MAG: hypothetical protein V9E88_11860 [Ferruginibacter sp.]